MTTSFVRRSIALYKMMDAETKRLCRVILNVSNNAKITDIENHLTQCENQIDTVSDLINDIKSDALHLKKNK